MICLDSDFILDLLKRKQNAVLKFRSLKGETIVSTEVSYFEILYGMFRRRQFSQVEMNLVQEFFDSLPNMVLDHSSAYNAAEIAGNLEKDGLTIGFSDSLIAGICLSNNCIILTKNVKHFSRIKGLKVETY